MKSPFCIDPSTYPEARRDETIVDDYHGTKINDPYRWMEDPDAAETKEYVDKLNDVSKPFIVDCPDREKLVDRLTSMWNFEKYSTTTKHGKYYYYGYNSGLQNQLVIYQQNSLDDKGKVFLDPNTLSDDGTTAIRISSWSKDGSIFAYGLSEKGSDWTTLKFKTAEGVDLPDVVTGVKHSSLSWMKDNSGVFYCRYPGHKGATEGTSTAKTEFHSLYFHKMGTDCKKDVIVYDRPDNKEFMLGAYATEDGKYLIVDVTRGCDPYSMLYYADLTKVKAITGKLELTAVFDKLDARYSYIDHDDTTMFILTNKDAPMFKLIRIEIADKSKITEVVAEQAKNKLDWVAPVAKDKMVIGYLEDVKTCLYLHDLATGERLYQLPMDIGSVSGFWGKKESDEMFFGFTSFTVPNIVYRVDFAGVKKTEVPKLEEIRNVIVEGLNAADFNVEQVFFESKDKTKIPMFIVSCKDMEKDGKNPTILNGYGGFNHADTPGFSVSRSLFIQKYGGIVAVANIRGGSEYGETWHTQGMRDKKQNVFDDFIAAAEFLIKEKYTSNTKLAIQGGSNGGLLVGAVSQQRPDLFGAVLNRVGVLDMLRFNKFTVGGAWVPEYGNPDDAKDFEFIYKYSPLHNLKIPENGQWPSTLLMTADHDDRVVPSHTLKYAATLYEKARSHPKQENPLLVRVEVNAGHGAGKPTSKLIAEVVDMYCFLQRTLEAKWQDN